MTINVGAPQAIYLVLILITLLGSLLMHGRSRGLFYFPFTLADSVLALAILYWGGFFDVG